MQIGMDLVVVNYKTPGDLEEFCRSYQEYPASIPTNLVIVNQDPEDADHEVGAAYADVHLPQANNYYSGAANVGAAHGDSEIIGILNADTRLLSGTLDIVYGQMMANDDWGVAGPLQYDDRGKVTHGGIFGSLQQPEHRGWHKPIAKRLRENEEAVTVSGSAYFIKRSVWDELTNCEVYRDLYPDVKGAFLPTTHYYEETWCSYHTQAHGYKVVYLGEAEMIHKWHQATPIGGWHDRQMPESRKMFREMCDHHGIPRD